MFTRIGLSYLLLFSVNMLFAQVPDKQTSQQIDSIYIEEIESKGEKPKVLHAEPLYIDLIRDLGAHKGEKEWNIGIGIKDNLNYDTYEALIEYEWAVIDRLGLEVELPFLIFAPIRGNNGAADSVPSSLIESLKLAAQWSFFVSEKLQTSLALGYIHQFELSPFREFARPLFTGNLYNPFFVAAKRWGQNWHTLVYTGTQLHKESGKPLQSTLEWHTNFHYMVPSTRNFIGIEANKYLTTNDFDMTIRPQMRLGISDGLMLGIVGGIPISRENERFSLFLRLIWEPGHTLHYRNKFH